MSNNSQIKIIKAHLAEDSRKPVIILIAGMHGVGKTTLAYHLAKRLDFPQRTGLGAIVKTLELFSDNSDNKEIIRKAILLKPEHLNWGNINQQAKIICKAVNNITSHAIKDGVDYIIEGVQLLPAYLEMKNVTLFVFLKSPDIKEYRRRLNHPKTHRTRTMSDDQIIKLKILEKEFLKRVRQNKSAIIFNSRPLIKVIQQVLIKLAARLKS